ncbi:MAG: DUF4249 family protein [Prevotellaceae bacterium]|jgi:hypothetical protein|nr:DUF4249 family protein [Prevotellaceae bacterium]
MKKLFYYSLFIINCSLIFSCTSRIEITTDDAEPRLVIFGAMSDNLQRHSIKISCSTGYFSDEEPPIIDNAIVTISSGNEVFNLNYLDSGRYFTDSMRFEYGKIYTLDVYLDFDNDGINEHYQAKSRMPKGPRVDTIMLIDTNPVTSEKLDMPMLLIFGEVYKDVYNTFCIYTAKNNEPQGLFDYYMMMSEDFIKTDFGVFTLPYFARGGIEVGDTVNCRIDDLPNEYININGNRWTNAYASFLSQCTSEAGMKTPFFSSPPAEVITNIRCLDADIKVSGFFAVFDRGEDLTTISTINFKFGGQ